MLLSPGWRVNSSITSFSSVFFFTVIGYCYDAIMTWNCPVLGDKIVDLCAYHTLIKLNKTDDGDDDDGLNWNYILWKRLELLLIIILCWCIPFFFIRSSFQIFWHITIFHRKSDSSRSLRFTFFFSMYIYLSSWRLNEPRINFYDT